MKLLVKLYMLSQIDFLSPGYSCVPMPTCYLSPLSNYRFHLIWKIVYNIQPKPQSEAVVK